ncbi:MAG: hypothetical protein H6596_05125 [Flavobacteriales bacterium]|nr:hypothetical protein [Flavobacteriales bacterium]
MLPRPFVCAALLLPLAVLAQCPTGNVTISSQADADNYALNYGNCDTLPGDLIISGFGISDLSGFADLDMITGTFDWNNTYPGPFDFTGFNSLDHIGGDLLVQNCQRLQGLWGLEQLDRVDGDLYVAGLDSVRDATGLSQLSVVGGKLQFFGMPEFAPTGLNQLDTVYGDLILVWSDLSLTCTLPNDLDFVGGELAFGTDHGTTVQGGNDLTRIGGDLRVCCEPTMTSFQALQSLQVVEGDLRINYNDVLVTFNALQQLDSVYGDLWINDNDVLYSVQGLNDLVYVDGLVIQDNPQLVGLGALDHAVEIQTSVQINNNPALAICHVQAVCDHINANGAATAYQNATGCNTVPEVHAACNPFPLLNVRVFLEGPYDPFTGLMHDSLRSAGLVPLAEPYTSLGYAHVGDGGNESTTAGVLAATGNDAIVDWVVLELRDATDPTTVVNTRSALLQRDGDIVDTDGSSPVVMMVPDDDYHVAVKHRNHLAVMTGQTWALSPGNTTTLDLSGGAIHFGTDPQREVNGVYMLWAGNVEWDGLLKYSGADNDRDPILQTIGGSVPTITIDGYHRQDVNMDGHVKYAGSQNDRDPILGNIGGTVPTATRVEQLP